MYVTCCKADCFFHFYWQNVALPCFLFSRIVPAISTHNISSLAPLAVVGMIYGITGTLMACTIRCFFWIPHRFRYGILAAGCWGNCSDMRMCTLPLVDRPICEFSFYTQRQPLRWESLPRLRSTVLMTKTLRLHTPRCLSLSFLYVPLYLQAPQSAI